YSTVYKSYLIDRQKGIFGMQIMNYRYVDQQGMTHYKGNYYLIFSVDGGDINLLHTVSCDEYSERVRAFIKNGIVYISTDKALIKQPLN
ncbi:MAG: hypothetical protein IKV43_02150, partial [Clostridia bacterium]|nr:hypothetical protein [Clostridia bacterium]